MIEILDDSLKLPVEENPTHLERIAMNVNNIVDGGIDQEMLDEIRKNLTPRQRLERLEVENELRMIEIAKQSKSFSSMVGILNSFLPKLNQLFSHFFEK